MFYLSCSFFPSHGFFIWVFFLLLIAFCASLNTISNTFSFCKSTAFYCLAIIIFIFETMRFIYMDSTLVMFLASLPLLFIYLHHSIFVAPGFSLLICWMKLNMHHTLSTLHAAEIYCRETFRTLCVSQIAKFSSSISLSCLFCQFHVVSFC